MWGSGGPPVPAHSLLFLCLISLQQSFCQEGFARNAWEAAPLGQRGSGRRRPLSLLWREEKRENLAARAAFCKLDGRAVLGQELIPQTRVLERVRLWRPAVHGLLGCSHAGRVCTKVKFPRRWPQQAQTLPLPSWTCSSFLGLLTFLRVMVKCT